MKIIVAGTRGIPNIQGGVETHCEELYPRLVNLGCDVTLIRRSCYVSDNNKLSSYKNVKLKDIYATKLESLETLIHTFLAVLYAKKHKADILHIHAIGPALMVPLARLLGIKVVMTNHGPDYDRQKWGKLAKSVLKIGEYLGSKFSDRIIVISEVINNIIKQKYKRFDAYLIYNGVNTPIKSTTTDYIQSLGLEREKYIFTLGRFVEEKGFDILIEAFSQLSCGDYKLVIAGDADHPSKYSDALKQLANEKGVILTGFIKGDILNELFSHARLFVLPSFHEGLPIALLEAMSYDLDVLVSDIPANKSVNLSEDHYFETGDKEDLAKKMEKKMNSHCKSMKYDTKAYNWDKISEQVYQLYSELYTNSNQ